MTPHSENWSAGSAKTSYFEVQSSPVLRRVGQFAAVALFATATILILQRDNLAAAALAFLACLLVAAVSSLRPRYSLLASRDFHDWTLIERRRGRLEQRILRDCYCSRYLVSLRLGPAAGPRWSMPVTVLLPADALSPAQHRQLRIGLLERTSSALL